MTAVRTTSADGPEARSAEDQAKLERIAELLPSLARISDAELAGAVADIWLEAWNESGWTDLGDIPKGIHADGSECRPLLEHINGVTEGAHAFAVAMQGVRGWSFDPDLLIAGGLLHDVSKVIEYAPDAGGGTVVSEFGREIQHGVWTTQRVLERGLGLELAHMIVSHTPVSRMVPHSVEALVLYYADMLDSDLLSRHAGQPLLLKK